MDDAHEGPYAREPQFADLVRICRALNDAGARYVLIGGFAVIAHGGARTTKDIDLLIDASAVNVAGGSTSPTDVNQPRRDASNSACKYRRAAPSGGRTVVFVRVRVTASAMAASYSTSQALAMRSTTTSSATRTTV